MNKKANKKNIARRFLVAGFFVLLTCCSLLISSPVKAVTNDYAKSATSTLTATEWNNLLLDFLSTGGGRVNGSVGINTATSSSYILNVNGGGSFTQPVVVGTPTDVSHAATMGYVNSTIAGGSGSTVGYWAMNGTGISNSNSGNVGIGTTNPQSKLDVTGGIYASGESHLYQGTYFDPAGGTLASVKISQNAASWAPSAPFSAGVNGAAGANYNTYGGYFNNASTVSGTGVNYGLYVIGSNNYFSGNVGIGTTTPTQKLDIQGGNVRIGPTAGSDTLDVYGSIAIEGAGGVLKFFPTSVYGSTGAALTFWNGSAVTNALKWTNTGNVLIESGNVGIGLTNPGTKLDITGSFRNSLSTTHTLLGGSGNVVVMADNTGTLYSTSTASFISGNSLDLWKGTKNGNIWNGDAGVGNVGIGTTNPLAKLQVIGGVISSPDSGGNSERFGLGSRATGGYANAFGNNTNISGSYSSGFGADVTVTGDYSTAFGSQTTLHGDDSLLLGEASTIGNTAHDTSRSIALGTDNYIYNSNVVAIGGAISTTHPNTLIIGSGAFSTAANQVVIGANNLPKTDIYFGNGVYNSSPAAYTIHGTRGNGSNIAGGNIQLAAGEGTGTGAGGSILFQTAATGTAGSAVNTLNTRAIIDANGNMGIGTTNPARRFDVLSSDYSGPSLISNTGVASFGTVGNTKLVINEVTSSPWPISLQVQDQSNAGSSYPISLNPLGGNVGIGLTNPGTRLDISGALRNSLATTHSLLGGSGNVVVMSDNTGTLYSTSTASFISGNSLDLWKGAKNGNIWNGDAGVGNVGIGTTNPLEKLNVSVADNAFGIRIDSSAADNTFNGIRFSYDAGVSTNDYFIGKIEAWKRPGGGGDLVLNAASSFNSYNTNQLVLSKAGNVGIGTTSPAQALDIVGGLRLRDNVTDSTDKIARIRVGHYLNAQPDVLMFMGEASSASNNIYYGGGSGTANAATSLRFFTAANNTTISGTERIRVDNNGNVGIGITNPGTKLDILGTLRNSLATTHSLLGGAGNAVVMTDNTGTLYSTSSASFISNNSLDLWKGTKNGNIWNGDAGVGNVGIGTTTPTSQLTVIGAANVTALDVLGSTWANDFYSIRGQRTDGTQKTRIKGDTNGNILFEIGGGSLNDFSGMTSALFVRAGSGNIGIGTTNPTTKLEVAGAVKFGDTTDACDANRSGAIKYNATSKQSYICDGKRWLNQKNCGIMTDDEGRTYGTVQIGGQCWMAENMNVGTMLATGGTEPNNADNVIEKWCNNSDPAQCALLGAYYNWGEAMRGSEVAGARGICPVGWHIPTDGEFVTLEKTVVGVIASPNAQYVCDFSAVPNSYQRCADSNGTDGGGVNGAGKSLRPVGVYSGDDLVGFNATYSGDRTSAGTNAYIGSGFTMWTSNPSGGSNAYFRFINGGYNTIRRLPYSRAYGFSVRCLKD